VTGHANTFRIRGGRRARCVTCTAFASWVTRTKKTAARQIVRWRRWFRGAGKSLRILAAVDQPRPCGVVFNPKADGRGRRFRSPAGTTVHLGESCTHRFARAMIRPTIEIEGQIDGLPKAKASAGSPPNSSDDPNQTGHSRREGIRFRIFQDAGVDEERRNSAIRLRLWRQAPNPSVPARDRGKVSWTIWRFGQFLDADVMADKTVLAHTCTKVMRIRGDNGMWRVLHRSERCLRVFRVLVPSVGMPSALAAIAL